MGDTTEIAWTDHTFNPWWGCQRVSPGCDHCYAEAWDRRFGGDYWDVDQPPRKTSDANWKLPHRWNRQVSRGSTLRKVFCGSMCDVFDNKAPNGQRDRLWSIIQDTPLLQWQLLTKRPGNIGKMLPSFGNPDSALRWFDHVWIGTTVEDRKHGKPRIDILRHCSSFVRFLSCEPLLEDLGCLDLTGIDWVIVGGESGQNARPMDIEWALNIQRQCLEQEVPFFFKQHGGKGKDKGGCLLNGVEVKQFPESPT